jgi:hypothetical protein
MRAQAGWAEHADFMDALAAAGFASSAARLAPAVKTLSS